MKQIYARQGDLLIEKVAETTQILALVKNPVLAGSHDGTHTVLGDVLYAKNGREHFVRASEDTSISHASRHKSVPLVAGQLYRIWPQIERRGDGDADVED